MSDQADRGRPARVPSVNELRPIAQGAKTDADRRWSYRAFRAVSIYVTWALLHTGVTPNQVTILSLVVAAAGLVLVALPAASLAITGCILLLLYHLLDRVDGELARYQQRYSLLGVYLDNAGHYLTGGGLLIAASFRLSEAAIEPRTVWLVGSLGAIAAIMSRVEKHAAFHLFAQYVMKSPGLLETVGSRSGPLTKEAIEASRADGGDSGRGILSSVGNWILLLTWFPIAVVMLLAGFVAGVASGLEGVEAMALYVVAGLQVVGYLGVEFANLSGNLGFETTKLSKRAGIGTTEE